jgi:hypothetical protein
MSGPGVVLVAMRGRIGPPSGWRRGGVGGDRCEGRVGGAVGGEVRIPALASD